MARYQGAKVTVKLSPACTQAIMKALSTRNARKGEWFVLIGQDGGLRNSGVSKAYTVWGDAVLVALDESLLIYNSRSHKVVQPVRATSKARLARNSWAHRLVPIKVQLHGPTLFGGGIDAGREIIRGGTYTWEDK